MIGMSDADQGGGPLAKASSEQLGDAPLGHDGPDMGARRHDAGPGSQRWGDPARGFRPPRSKVAR